MKVDSGDGCVVANVLVIGYTTENKYLIKNTYSILSSIQYWMVESVISQNRQTVFLIICKLRRINAF